MLDVIGVDAGYNKNPSIREINMSFPEGKIVSILGTNGAGKSTIMRVISGLITPMRGKVMWQGKDVSKLPPEKRVDQGIVYCPEGRGIFADLTVIENLKVAASSRRSKKAMQSNLTIVGEFFPVLKERFNQVAGTLSGGEQQMLAIGRALMSVPKVLLLDEPSMGLGPLIVKEIFGKVADIRKQGSTIVLVEQNAQVALGISDYVYVMEHGSVVLEGKPKTIAKDEHLKALYLGKIQKS